MANDNNSPQFDPDPLRERPLAAQEGAGGAWPRQPDPYRAGSSAPETPASDINTCPHCHRKLLSKRSILCNWCGKRIEDAEYLERAALERAVEDARVRDQVEKELQETAKMGIIGRLTRRNKAPKRDPSVLIPPSDLL